jgi:hypothetical protein
VRIDTGEAVYTLDVDSPRVESGSELPQEDPTPEEIARSIEGIDKATGGWVGLVDAEALKTYVRERRRTSNRPPVAWRTRFSSTPTGRPMSSTIGPIWHRRGDCRMSALPRAVRVPTDSELSLVLREAASASAPVLVDTGDAIYTIEVESTRPGTASEALLPGPTPEQVARSIEGMRKAAGSWKDIDAEAFKAYIRERRRSSSRPPVKLDTQR